jgi:hypothetical protein
MGGTIHGAYGAGSAGESRAIPIGVFETAPFELVGADEQVDQNDYGAHVEVDMHGSGEILSAMFLSIGGDILEPSGQLLIFNAAVTVAAGATSITTGERGELIGIIDVAASDWQSDVNGASAFIYDQPIPYNTNDLYFVWFHTDATSINSAAEDDEELWVNLLYRLDHRES